MKGSLTANAKLSHYRVVSELGAGGMGEVYLAEDTRLRRKIALKVLSESLAQDKERLRRFEQEAFAASALNHPNILTICEFGTASTEAGETHFLAAELIDGETLRARLQRAPLSLNETLDIAVQTAQALTAAHDAHIIHRDIKPENIMLRKDGIVKVLDFGLAKLTETRNVDFRMRNEDHEDAATLIQSSQNNPPSPIPNPQLTMPGTVMGTVAYMSPEQARGNVVDARTDIFSLGVMLYEMLARRQPFTGETVNHIIVAILEKEPPPLPQEIPAELAHMLKLLLAKNAEGRYPSAQALLADLKKLQKRWEFAAEHKREDEPAESQTLRLKQTTATEAEALATAANSGQQSSPLPTKQKWWFIGVLSLLALAIGFFGYRSFTPNGKQIESIAVLPFVNASGNAEVEYLSDGMTETLISSLSQLPHLNVKARSSVFRYKGREFDLPKIAQELKVQAILTGRVVQRGEQLTLSLELVDTQTENALWSEQYNRRQTDLVTLQSEIAWDVSSKLKLKLSGADEAKLTKANTANSEAYKLYLKGRYHATKYTEEGFNKGIESFNQAIALDPAYAQAYDGLAYCYYASWYLPAKEGGVQGKAAAKRALEIDPTLAEAHSSLAAIYAWFDYNWAAAEREFRQALKLNPNYGPAHAYYGFYLAAMSRFEEAIAEAKRAVELEPLSAESNTALGIIYYYAQRYAQAADQLNQTIKLEPNFWWAHTYLARVYEKQGKLHAAIAQLEQARRMAGATPEVLAALGYAHAVSGNRDEAQKIIAALKEQSKRGYVPAYGIAVIHAGLGEKDQAFIYLDKEYDGGFWFLNFLRVDPDLEAMRADSRFTELLRRIGLQQ